MDFGTPKLVRDNGHNFCFTTLYDFRIRVTLKFSYHPSRNGQARKICANAEKFLKKNNYGS